MNYYKTIITLSFILLAGSVDAQLKGISGGLVFSSGVEYQIGNTGETGTTANPGFYGKGYLKVTKRFSLVPSIIAFKPFNKTDINSYKLKTYMFQGDIDGIFAIFKDRNLRLSAYSGINATSVMQRWKIIQETNFTSHLSDNNELKPGLNLGAALNLYINDNFDGYVTAKYILSSFDQVVINIGIIYYPGKKHRKGTW